MKNEYDFNRYPQFERFKGDHRYLGQDEQFESEERRRNRTPGFGWLVAVILLAEIAFYAAMFAVSPMPQGGADLQGPRPTPSSSPSALPQPIEKNSFLGK